jgi:hypothetical protein
MSGRNNSVQRAIQLAASRYSPQQWLALPPGQRTRAIYHELRQLDTAVTQAESVREEDALSTV